MSTLVDLWRMTFGKFNEKTRSSLQQSGPGLRRLVLFCSVDGDLAVLQFYELVSQLQSELELQASGSGKEQLCVALQSVSARCNEHRLLSAMQISFLHSTVQGISSPGFQGKSGLKAYIQDIAAHPRPYLVVEALSLAAKVFSEEVHSCVVQMDTKRASEMTAHLDTCLKGLQGLKQTLVMFPDVSRKVPWGRNKGD
ncbi:hypothetical protein BDV59DRAFT_211784 [Aspergillus ambiguus]|uniref:uncharacterized protein n=1 Tax=Aspergillus ambiguus TaxID=176160 RepID=UPI003CCCBFC2